jgi:hypothetical protein
MEVITRILPVILFNRPEYIISCYAVGFVEMITMHLPAIIEFIPSATLRADRIQLDRYFRDCIHVLRAMCHHGTKRWYTIIQVGGWVGVVVNSSGIYFDNNVCAFLCQEERVPTTPKLKDMQAMNMYDIEGRCAEEITILMPELHKLVENHELPTAFVSGVYFVLLCVRLSHSHKHSCCCCFI